MDGTRGWLPVKKKKKAFKLVERRGPGKLTK